MFGHCWILLLVLCCGHNSAISIFNNDFSFVLDALPFVGRSTYNSENNVDLVNVDLKNIDPNVLEDAHLKTPELIYKYGYESEIHHVQTLDGYILEMHRIPKPGGKPVLLMHGLLDSSSTWIMMGPEKGFAYMLADLGYDVWMGNVRGNTYSRNHTTLDPNKSQFWQFSIHEIGEYDIPAMIDYVVDSTSSDKIHYIGHSQGTTTFWIMCSIHPEYVNKISLMQAFAPVAFVKHCGSPVVEFLSLFQDPISFLLKLIGSDEFLPNNEFLKFFSHIICEDERITRDVCMNIVFLMAGFDQDQLNATMFPVIVGHAPAGASTKQIMHFGQLKRSGRFCQYDYGILKNLYVYGQVSPPEYDLSLVKVKVALHYANNDWLAEPRDVETLYDGLPNVVGRFLVRDAKFNHVDFVWGIDAKEMLYNRAVKLIDLVEKGMV